MKYTVSPCGVESAAVLAALHAEIFAGAEVWSVNAFREIFTVPGTQAYIAHQNDTPLGMVVYRFLAGEVEILTLGTVITARRCGIAQAMMRAVVTLGTVFLEVSTQNTKALSLYKSLGFTIVGRRKRYYQDGSDAHVLRL